VDKKISVIIPIYNAEKYLKPMLDSVRFQGYKNLEIICVLDCPADNSAEIVENIAKEDVRIKPIRNPQSVGPSLSRNIGVVNAVGEYIHFMDSDDLISPDFYETMISAAIKADCDVTGSCAFYEKKPRQSVWFFEEEVVFGRDKINKTRVITEGWAWRYLIRKSFWDSYKLSFPDLVMMGDVSAMVEMIYYANKVALCPDAVYFYKNRENSILNSKQDQAREKRRREDRHKANKILNDFMHIHKIKKNNRDIFYYIPQDIAGKIVRKSYRIPYKRAGKMVCINDSIEYGKIDKKISVIIPIYNAEKHLKQTLDSVRFQTYKNLEIICVLDCPTDNSAKIIEESAKEDNRIKPVYNLQNMGLPLARNTGVENATGEYIHFFDADDLISPDFYETMISAAVKEDSDVAACSVFYEKKPTHSIWFRKSEVLSTSADKIEKTFVTIQGWAWRYLIRKSFWENNKLSFPDLVPMEDLPIIIPMIYYANKVVLCPSAVYFYKYRASSILNQKYDPVRKKQHHDNRHKARKIFGDFMRDHKIKKTSKLFYLIKRKFM